MISKCRKAAAICSMFSPVVRCLCCLTAWVIGLLALVSVSYAAVLGETKRPSFQVDRIGVNACRQYTGEGLSIVQSANGASLNCMFQKLIGHVTPEGLWLESTGSGGDVLRLAAVTLERGGSFAPNGALPPDQIGAEADDKVDVHGRAPIAAYGRVEVAGDLVRFSRVGVVEEYSTSVDGVRQDFVISQRPAGVGNLRVELALSGARAEKANCGVKLVLERSGRKLSYNRLRAVDASGQELAVRMEVLSANRLALLVSDVTATYPVRIDPTFSDANWKSLNTGIPGASSQVFAQTVDGNGNVYVGGDFSFIGTVQANFVAKWNGSVWSPLGSGMAGRGGGQKGPRVYCLACDNRGNVYAGGDFTTAGEVTARSIAVWNGITWSALGSGINGSVYALAVNGTNVYVGGYFSHAGGVPAAAIAVWNGSSWSGLGSGLGSDVYALAVDGVKVYAGGDFSTAGGAPANCLAVWDGSAWSGLGAGFGGTNEDAVYAIAVSGTNVYVGGYFASVGAVPATNIAVWDGSVWSSLDAGFGEYDTVTEIGVGGTNVYVGGYFTSAGGVAANHIAVYSGNAWSALGSGMAGGTKISPSQTGAALGSVVYVITVSGTNVYAGGQFTRAGGVTANHIAVWNGNAWSALGSGMGDVVNGVAVGGTSVYAVGYFTSAGGTAANRVARWNDGTWSALGSGIGGVTSDDNTGVDPTVYAVAVSGNNVYVGGDFTTAGGIVASNVAVWNGSIWLPLGSGMNAPVYALAVSGSNVYAGGRFTVAGGVTATYVAVWNGHAWSSLRDNFGNGTSGDVTALAVSGTTVYVGGRFTSAGSAFTANYIAVWNGHVWSNLGSGMDSVVWALAASGSNLYAGGHFTMAGGAPAKSVALWNGSGWLPLGSGMDFDVYALAVSGSNLYAGGHFTAAGGVPANSIAAWNGSAWSVLGSGVGGFGPSIYSLAIDNSSHLFVAGNFSSAGTNVSPFIAQANIGPEFSSGQFSCIAYSAATGIGCTFSDATIGQPYRIQTSTSLTNGSWTDLTNFTFTGPILVMDPSATAVPKKFYRAVSP
jgi:hypothetical protein